MTALDQDIGTFPDGMVVAMTGKYVIGTGTASYADGRVSSRRDSASVDDGEADSDRDMGPVVRLMADRPYDIGVLP